MFMLLPLEKISAHACFHFVFPLYRAGIVKATAPVSSVFSNPTLCDPCRLGNALLPTGPSVCLSVCLLFPWRSPFASAVERVYIADGEACAEGVHLGPQPHFRGAGDGALGRQGDAAKASPDGRIRVEL
eukprot:1188025-Prorocentrum_minimum.AAC.1